MMKSWKQLICAGLACVMLSVPFLVFAETDAAKADEGQLTLDDLDALNGGAGNVFSHDGRVTFVDGTCSESPISNQDEAAAVVDSMMTLIGAEENTDFVPWREATDPVGNHYYIFHQVYNNFTVCGGAVKIITDPEGNMIALSSSVESEMPEAEPSEGISAEEAQKIVEDYVSKTTGQAAEILDSYTDTVILPMSRTFDIYTEDLTSRFAWVVYTNNYSGSVTDGSDLPYLAHYVSMSGEYLYNMPAIVPADEAGKSGYDSSYIFEFMEPAEYTGYVDLSDGTEKEVTVTVMRDKRTGMYYLGNIERKILIGQCYDFLYNGGQVVLEASPDNLEWDQVGLLSLYNYCKAWDYYHEIGWTGGDGESTPILVLNNYCDDHCNEINNACYIGKIYGMQCFAASRINDYSQCLDIIAHEFTHCVTGSLMTYNSYMNDYGAINEAMSDIQGKTCDMMAGNVEPDNWLLGAASVNPARNMEDPHALSQPEYTWDLFYKAKVKIPTTINDYGGVHTNSSLLNRIAYLLYKEGGMTLEEGRIFWFMTDCTMVPQTDYAQLAELLPVVLKAAGMEQYQETLAKGLEETRLGVEDMPETMDDDRALVTLSLPDTEAFDSANWQLAYASVDLEKLIGRILTIAEELYNEDYSSLPESLQKEIAEQQAERESHRGESSDGVGEIIGAFLKDLVSQELKTEAEPEDSDDMEALRRDLLAWLTAEYNEVKFSSTANAGQDGSTLKLVVRPGRTIPLLFHVVVPINSDQLDQLVQTVYLNGKWYDLNELSKATESGEQPAANMISQFLTENPGSINSLDDLLNLFSVDVEGGEIVELSSDGLDQIVIPEPTPLEDKEYATIGAGKKSRPKQEDSSAEQDEAA